MVVGLHFVLGLGETHVFIKGQRLSIHTSHSEGWGLYVLAVYGQMSKCEPPNAFDPQPRLKGSVTRSPPTKHWQDATM